MNKPNRKHHPGPTRREPRVAFSPALVACRWPKSHIRDAVIALFYQDRDQLVEDYHRVGAWKRFPGLAALVPTAHLERSPGKPGIPYLDFGWRRYLPKETKPRFQELSQERIAVQVAHGGKNRGSVINGLSRADDLFVVFSLVPSFEDKDALVRRAKELFRDQLVPFGDTEPIPLRGLTVFGRFVPTRLWRAQPMTN